MKKLYWFIGCLIAGALVVPVSSFTMWAMRSTFLGPYDDLKRDCQRVTGVELTADQEAAPEETLAAHPELAACDYCKDLLTGLAAYQAAVNGRSLGFGLIVIIGLLIVRFIMFPMESAPSWVERER